MNLKKPKISVLVTTYNRSEMISKCLDSILNQTFQDFELVVLENGSTDNTKAILKTYEQHDKVKIHYMSENLGCRGGYNYLYDQIQGEWFTTLGDDDTLKPDCLETLINVPKTVDPSIDAVTCNVIDTATGKLGGRGLDKSQYLPISKIVGQTEGEFFGITKTALLGDIRMNEELNSHDDAFWYKIDAIANRYYIHQPLRYFHTGAETSTSQMQVPNLNKRTELYDVLYKEPFYFECLKKYKNKKFIFKCLSGLFFTKISKNRIAFDTYLSLLKGTNLTVKQRGLLNVVKYTPAIVLKHTYKYINSRRKQLV